MLYFEGINLTVPFHVRLENKNFFINAFCSHQSIKVPFFCLML